MKARGHTAGRIVALLAAFSVLASISAAQAQTTAPASRTTMPTMVAPPENCQLSVSEADLDYGATTRYGLQRGVGDGNDQGLSLGKRRVTLNVSCRTPARIGLRFRGPSVGAEYQFGSQGRVALRLMEPRLDGRSILVGTASAAGLMPVAPANAVRFAPGQVIVPVENGKAVPGERFSAVVEIDPVLPESATHVRNRTAVETQGTFEVEWR